MDRTKSVIGFLYFWLSKTVAAVLIFTGAMSFLGRVGTDAVIVYVASFFITAYVLKETW